jgi:hypothetical protein
MIILFPTLEMQGGGGPAGIPQWVVSLIIMASCATLSLIMLAINRLIRYVQARAAGAHRSSSKSGLGRPSLGCFRLSAAGSVMGVQDCQHVMQGAEGVMAVGFLTITWVACAEGDFWKMWSWWWGFDSDLDGAQEGICQKTWSWWRVL